MILIRVWKISNFYDLLNSCLWNFCWNPLCSYIWLLTHILAQPAQKIVLGNYAMHTNEIMAPEDGEHDLQNMFSEIWITSWYLRMENVISKPCFQKCFDQKFSDLRCKAWGQIFLKVSREHDIVWMERNCKYNYVNLQTAIVLKQILSCKCVCYVCLHKKRISQLLHWRT